VDLEAIACVHSLQYSTVQYSISMPSLCKRKISSAKVQFYIRICISSA